jgi:hypothetical protein
LVAVLDEGSLLATCADIDLNLVAAGMSAVPEPSEHTSIQRRVARVAVHPLRRHSLNRIEVLPFDTLRGPTEALAAIRVRDAFLAIDDAAKAAARTVRRCERSGVNLGRSRSGQKQRRRNRYGRYKQ